MNDTSKFALPAVAAALILGLAYLLWPTGDGSNTVAPVAGGATLDGKAPLGDVALAEGALAGSDAGSSRTAEVAPATVGETEATTWLAGKVVRPPGTPADEILVVLALDRAHQLRELLGEDSVLDRAFRSPGSRGNALLASALVDDAGNYRLAIPDGTRTVHLALAGRYVFTLATTAVRLPAERGPDLTGELGAWMTGVLLLPLDATEQESELAGAKIQLGPDLVSGFASSQIAIYGGARVARAAADGSFELRALPSAGAYALAVVPDHLAANLHSGIEVEPGQHLVQDIALLRGARLLGRVVDTDGAPIPSATVDARWRGTVGDAVGWLRRTQADKDGRYELANVAPGRVDLVANARGKLESTTRVDPELVDGDLREGMTIELAAGATIAGCITYPDGAVAVGAHVRAAPDLSQMTGINAGEIARTRGGYSKSGDDGRFAIEGLAVSLFKVDASLDVDEGERAGTWSAQRSGVAPGAEACDLVLERLVALHGRVVDDATDEPIHTFSVQAELEGSGAMFGIGADRRYHSVRDATDGSFVFDGLAAKAWIVQVTALDHAPSEPRRVLLQRTEPAPPETFRLMRAAGIAGRVVDPAGAPVPGARVSLVLDLAAGIKAEQTGTALQAFASSDGSFELGGLTPGALSIVAAHDGFAPSDAYPFELAAGQVVEGALLTLRVGGTITGVVYGDDGEPAPGRMIVAQITPTYTSQHIRTSDSKGEFRIDHLEPGTWQVVATQSVFDGETTSDGGAPDTAAFLASMKMASAAVTEGEVVHVVLGAPPANPVAVHGRVVHAGKPVAGAMISFVPEGLSGATALGGMKFKVSDEHGEFEIVLDQAGDHLLTVQMGAADGFQNSVEYLERIPTGAETHEVVIELPGARISGHVRDETGAPLAECRVTLNVSGGMAFGSLMGGNYVEVRTDKSGAYDVPYLRAGSYSVAAGGAPVLGMFGAETEFGRVVRGDIALGDGEWLQKIDFELAAPVKLTGTVVDTSGTPIAGASVFVRNEDGRTLERFSMVSSDNSGRFTYTGLAPGSYRVSARKSGLVSAESAFVRVSADDSGNARLMLDGGTVLRIAVVDDSDEMVQTKVSVVDRNGYEVSGLVALADLMESLGESFSGSEHRVGPLAPGEYTITAVHPDGRTRSRTLDLEGSGEKRVVLRLR